MPLTFIKNVSKQWSRQLKDLAPGALFYWDDGDESQPLKVVLLEGRILNLEGLVLGSSAAIASHSLDHYPVIEVNAELKVSPL